MIALDLGVDTTSPNGEAMAGMAAVFGQLERRLISERTKLAFAQAKARGTKLGRPQRTGSVEGDPPGSSGVPVPVDREAIPGMHKFHGEIKFDIGAEVLHEGHRLIVGGIARSSDGFVYMLRRPRSRKQFYARENRLSLA